MSRAATPPLDRGALPWLMGAAFATTLPHVAHQPLWLSALAGLMLSWAAGQWCWHRPLPGRGLRWLLVAVACGGVLAEYGTLLGRDAGVALLVLFMAMKLLEAKRRRDGLVLITLGYFLLLTHYFHSQSIATGAWLLLATWLLTASLIRLHGGPASTPRATLRHAGLLTLQALPFMLLLYLLFPRVAGPLWGLPQDAQAGRSGLSEQMTPGSIANLAQNGEIAFRARFAGTPPAKDKLYWRGPVLEAFDGDTWRPANGPHPAERIEALAPPLTYETTLEAHNQRWLLALDAPVQLAPNFALNGTLTATSRARIEERQRFRLASSLSYRFNVLEEPAILRRNLALPPGRNPRTRALAESWQKSGDTPARLVERALQFFAQGDFAYTLQPPLLGEQGIDDFLFQTRRGFCEHYAAAFVVLMRAAAVPARVVTGYQGGEQNPLDGYLVVRQSDAHAWAEVWLENRGWLRVDPTAVVAPRRIEAGIAAALPAGAPLPALLQIHAEWLRALRQRWEAANNAWNQHILGYTPQRQREFLARLGLPDADWPTLAGVLAATCGALLAGIAGWTFYQRPRRDPASKLWQKAVHRLARRRVNCPPWETPGALVARLQTERPDLAGPLANVAAAYLKARYGRARGDLKELRQALSQLP